MKLSDLLGIELPIIQAPMAGAQGHALAVAVSNAGALGSIGCATLGIEAVRSELAAIKAGTGGPFNVNFFCHVPPVRRCCLTTGSTESIRKKFPPDRAVRPSAPRLPPCWMKSGPRW